MNTLSRLLTGILLFIALFYNLEPGINTGIFVIAIWLLTYFVPSRKPVDTFYWILSASCVLSVFSFAMYGDEISFFALFFSTAVTVMYRQYPKLNVVTYPVIFGINLLTFPFRVFFLKLWIPKSLFKTGWKKWIATGLIPLLFLMLFTFVYTTGSDLFSDFFRRIFFDIDLVQMILLGILSFFILFNLWCLWVPRLIVKLNCELENDFGNAPKNSLIPSFSFFDKNLERRSGEITFVLLNILLLVFIILYNYEQFFASAAINRLSDEVHQRIATVIISILLAIGLILFYFKSKINLQAEGKFLKILSFTWIVLNALLVISAFIKNGEYILNYGLTFKRISVLIFLLLCLIGLYFTWHKIAFYKTNIFLISRMAWILFFTLIINAPVNFSRIVTKYNISNNKKIDAAYLQSLRYNKAVLYDHFKDDAEWKAYFSKMKSDLQYEKDKPFLSSFLYYKLLKFD